MTDTTSSEQINDIVVTALGLYLDGKHSALAPVVTDSVKRYLRADDGYAAIFFMMKQGIAAAIAGRDLHARDQLGAALERRRHMDRVRAKCRRWLEAAA